MTKLLDEARFYVSHNIVPIPTHHKSKLPYFQWKYWQTRLPREKELCNWFASDHDNIAILCGGYNKLIVIDFDTMEKYQWFQMKCIDEGGIWMQVLEYSYKVRTSRGIHVYVKSDHRVESRKLKCGMDIKSDNSYVLVPPSVHPSGARYEKMQNEFQLFTVSNLEEFLEIPKPEPVIARQLDDIWDMDIIIQRDSSNVDMIKQSIPLLSYVSRLTHMECKSHDGRWYYGRCIAPNHEDRNPSFRVDAINNVCSCQSSHCDLFCEKGMDVIALHAMLNHMSMKESIQDLMVSLEVRV